MLKLCFEAYTRRFPDDEEGIHFYEWLDALPNHELVPILKQNVNVYDKGVLDWHMIVNFKRGVQYMDKETRRSYKIDFWGGTAFRRSDGKEFDTSQNETAFSGKGYAIWVMKDNGRMFAGDHIKGHIHHSSFLEGGDVMCGGELLARSGKVKVISAKSGHYRPSMVHLAWALRVLETCTSNYHEMKVMAWRAGNPRGLHLISPAVLRAAPNNWGWGDVTAIEIARVNAGNYGSFPNQ
jgi:hypothetical protein